MVRTSWMESLLERAGRVLFRFRSFTPVPVLAAAIAFVPRGTSAHSGATLWGGLALCATGEAVRAWVLGQVPDGTSGQNATLHAVSLNTRGPYAYSRNPLYLGNLGITLGLCIVARSAAVLGVVAALFALQYRAVIAAEERFLRHQFGEGYDAYRKRVPRFWPGLGKAAGSATPAGWDLRRVLRKEHNAIAAWLAVAIGIDAVVRFGRPSRAHAAALALVAAPWLVAKAWKHSWLRGNFRADLQRRVREIAR